MGASINYSEKLSIIACFLILSFAAGCAHVRSSPENSRTEKNAGPKSIKDVLLQDKSRPKSEWVAASTISPTSSVQDGEIIVQGIKLKNTHFDFPITINSRVENWIDYFCGRGRGYFTKYLERSEFFIPYIAPLLKQNNMPEDLVYLAMIESGFNNLARSHAKAVGPWQFISATGKRYGLMVNWWVDERRDIRKSTLAAVEYLRDLYAIFQSWELASAAYNAGESKIARGVRRFGSKDFWVLSKHRFLRPETRDYVPKIIAAAIIAKNRGQFGFPETGIKAAEDEAVAPDGELVKVIKTDKPVPDSKYEEEKEADKKLLSGIAELNDEEVALSQAVDGDGVAEKEGIKSALQLAAPSAPQLASDSSLPLARSVPTPHVTKKGEVGGEELTEYEIQSPADLLKIARAGGLSYQTVKNLNPEILRWCTPPTLGTYRVKLPASVKDKFLATYNHIAYPRKVHFMTYKVHRGETLSRIASHFGIRVDPISDLNGVSPKVALRAGLQVLLPMPNDRSRNLASLEVRDPPERRRSRRSRRHSHKYYKINYKHRESARNVPASASPS
ncbi:MAG: transglycosylase SLT domain-containing protein [Bdellovibrionia bacterium]